MSVVLGFKLIVYFSCFSVRRKPSLRNHHKNQYELGLNGSSYGLKFYIGEQNAHNVFSHLDTHINLYPNSLPHQNALGFKSWLSTQIESVSM